MDTDPQNEKSISWLDRPISAIIPKLTIEHLLITLIIIAAILSRFYAVGLRVMSHDEVNHVVPSFELYQGRGYSHDPVTHGPLQFHLVAASYFLFGDSDFSSRFPAALFSIATILFVIFAYRRYLGRVGALLAGFFFLISPFLLFYGRYTRNEAFVALFGVVMLYTVLRYLENGKHANLYLFSAVLALHFATKETAFIYTAQLLIFLVILFIRDATREQWTSIRRRDIFILLTLGALLLLGVTLGTAVLDSGNTAVPADTTLTDPVTSASPPSAYRVILLSSFGLAVVALIAAIIVLVIGVGWHKVKNIRSFDLLLLTATLILPQLIAVPISLVGWNPLDYSQTGMIRTSVFLLGALLVSVALGIVWKPRLWLINFGLFYAIFTVFYTTFFTNGQGFFTGMVGSLGYWLSQQGVNRGSQPWYFFAFLQIPMYEYLPAIGTIVATIVGLKHRLFFSIPGPSPAEQVKAAVTESQLPLPINGDEVAQESESEKRLPVLFLLLFWSVLSLLAYTIAGEKMPWLTVHIATPLILSAGFGLGFLLETTPFKRLKSTRGILTLVLLPVFLISLGEVITLLLGNQRPFAGKELAQLQVTSTFLFSLICVLLTGWLLFKRLLEWKPVEIARILFVTFIGILAILTARSAYQASFINYDTAKEFMVYAHSARGPKDVLEQVEEISLRTTSGKDIKVAYIGDALYPYWWYFRDYPNKVWLKDEFTRDLLNFPVVISDDDQYSKVIAILKDGYVDYKYKRLVWPMQDYFNLTWERIWSGIKNPEIRQAIFNIWLNKDYSLYATVANNNGLTLENWQPSGNIHLLIRKDIVADIWDYGTLPVAEETVSIDPYEEKYVELTPDSYFGSDGLGPGQLSSPRGIAIAPDGSIYIADSRNHRVQKFSPEGQFLSTWGSFASVDSGQAPGGTFNEPWGIAVAPDGSVYVADTWNYRIQKFTADGKFVTMWGTPGSGESPLMFWGPRGVAVDAEGHVFVTDTGNNRVVIFDQDGKFLSQFGSNGINPGEFDEPVGIAIDSDGLVYVVDTWNQRIQVFEPVTGGAHQFVREWTVSAWFGQSINNKPFLALDGKGSIFVTDPDAFRVLQFDGVGNLIRAWGNYSSGIDGFASPSGITTDSEDRTWITDSENNYVLRFTLPPVIEVSASQIPGLPPIPEGLVYNPDRGLVESVDKIPVYQLSEDAQEWIPYIPQRIAALLPPDSQPQKDEAGNWVLLADDGSPLFTWDTLLLQWIQVITTPGD